jgi:endonuclease/exonuclease/phosphatase family metal-dependent hydrolase
MEKQLKKYGYIIITILIIIIYLVQQYQQNNPAPPPASGAGYLLCFWNVENFFDDKVDGWDDPDKAYDEWFASDPRALELKLENLCKVLLLMNGGKGPDVLGIAELESTRRAIELLRDALNSRLKDPELHYKYIALEENRVGRYISTALLSRVPIVDSKTRKLDGRMRTVEAHLQANGHELVVIVSHWTSRATDQEGGQRAKYANKIYDRYKELVSKAGDSLDFLACGDFNDNPDDPSLTEHLHATADLNASAGGGPPLLFNLLAGQYKQGKGTHYYGRNAFVFDHIVVSPGLLRDPAGWSCDPASAEIFTDSMADRRGRPHRFGNRKDEGVRGYADHFPVTVRLKVEGVAE